MSRHLQLTLLGLVCLAFTYSLTTNHSALAQGKNAEAEDPYVVPDPKSFGLEIPDGPPRPGYGRLVLVRDELGEEVTAKLHVMVSDHSIVVLPSGRLHSLPTAQTKTTEKPYQPWSKAQLLDFYTKQTFKNFKTRSTAHYVYVYDSSDVFAKGTSAILESMYPPLMSYLKRSKLDVQEPDVPLPVVMFRSEDDFQKYREMPSGVVAYYDTITNQVIMYEQSRLGQIAPEMAVKQAISTVAHEGVHQILHNVGVQQRLSRWPMWISEGLPEYFSPTEVKASRWKGVGMPNDMRLYELGQYLESVGGATSTGDTVQKIVTAPRLTSTGYAASWGLVHYLAKNKEKEFFAYLRELSNLGPLEGQGDIRALDKPKEEQIVVFKRHFGDELPKMEQLMIRHLQRLPYADPFLNQTHYVVRILHGNLLRTFITTSPASIYRMQKELEGSAARVSVQAYPNRQTAEVAASR